ncbi:MAG TPA: insulinase family protein [Anaerolineae bacterium]|nr:insulinase family protein [Caldilineae bacterium]HID35153.1 insulinase family protein [Anaerolineae bacterium]
MTATLSHQAFETYQLPNGLTVALTPIPCVRSLAMGLYLQVGARYEKDEEAGVSHFLEHMAFKGCRGWPTALDIANAVEGRGGYLNASTSYEFTTFWVKIGARHWRESLHLLASMVLHPLLDPDEMARERGVILDEIAMYRDVPEDLVSQLGNKAMWGEHPLGREIAGELERVAALSREALSAFHARAYRPERAVLTLAGAMDPSAVRRAIEEAFGGWRGEGEAPEMPPAPPAPSHPPYRIARRNSEQAHLQLAVPGLPRMHPQRFVLRLLNVMAGEGMSSRLWQRLREERGLTYNIGSFTNTFHDAGILGVYGGCDAARLFEALDGVMAVWEEIQARPASEEELNRFKEYLRGRTELASEDTMSVAAWWGMQLAAGAKPMSLDEVLAKIEAVTPEEVQQLARQLWRRDRLALGYVGPIDSEQRLIDWLAASNR